MGNTQPSGRDELHRCRRIIVKVGTRLITEDNSLLNTRFLDQVAQQMAVLRERGPEVEGKVLDEADGSDFQFIIVTSGAIFLGRRVLGISHSKDSLPIRQAAAAAGQPRLMHLWSEALHARGLRCGQMLLTLDDMSDRGRYLNVRNTIETLMENEVIPVINENDSVSVEGITFEENDRLAAMVASTAQADLAIYLSDLKGLYTADPRRAPDARLINTVEPDEDYSACAEGAGGPESRGGMIAKLEAARTLSDCGIPVVMASGHTERVISRIIGGETIGTFFVPRERVQARKQWIATAGHISGQIVIDQGARGALEARDGSSLLPVGVVEVRGNFESGDLVRIVDEGDDEVARGLSNYGSDEVRRIAGAHTQNIEEILGHVGHDEVVHRDNMVMADTHSLR